MNKFMQIFVLLAFATSVFAINPVKDSKSKIKNSIEEGKVEIDKQLDDLMSMEAVISEENLNYEELAIKHPNLTSTVAVSPEVPVGIMDGADDVPLGIPGFWWGFCLGWVGLVIVYISMDEGEDRKEQVKNGLYGCLSWLVIWSLIYFTLIVSTV